MHKLQYDSFYKFLVSAGIILIVFPVAGLVFFINSDVLLITQSEYQNLSDYSLQALQQKETFCHFMSSLFPNIAVIFLLIGFVLLIYGCYKWNGIQSQLDDQVKYATIMQKINAEKMTAEEVLRKATAETLDTESDTAESQPTDHNTEQNTQVDPVSDMQDKPHNLDNRLNDPLYHRVMRYLEVEDVCYNRMFEQYGKHYNMQRHVKIAGKEYDFIGVSKSKHNNRDILFEVKYGVTPVFIRNILRYVNSFEEAGIHYEKNAHRNFELVMLIVTSVEKLDVIKHKVRCQQSQSKRGFEIKYLFFTEEELFSE